MAKNKHITEPDVFGYQVRIVRRGKESSRYFSHKLWGNKNKSLNAAITWRDQMLVVLKGSRFRDIQIHFLVMAGFALFFNSWAIWNYKKTS